MAIEIRDADLEDFEQLVLLAQEFIRLTPYGQLFPPAKESVEQLVAMTLDRGRAWVAVDGDQVVGCIAGALAEHRMFAGQYCEEVMWYVRESARGGSTGIRLLVALEQWAATNGAVMCKMAAPAESPVGMLLERQGYAKLETNFLKVIAPPTFTEPIVVRGVDADDLQRAVRQGRQQQGGRRGGEPGRADGTGEE